MLKAMLKHLGPAVVIATLLSGCATSQFTFPNATPDTPRRVPAVEYRPQGAGPFPAVVLLHGCHGVSASTYQWGRWFRDHGYVALVVDSWTPRGFSNGCIPSAPEIGRAHV